jgi:SAM-dependent methyltransferase
MDASRSASLDTFAWPTPPQSASAPQWNGREFRLEQMKPSSVLSYTETDSHWSDDLTLLHEAEAGQGDHPIDVASRQLALRALQDHLPEGAGVVLDVGCSSGFLLRDLRRSLVGVSLIGSDYIAGPLHRLAQTLPGVPLLQFDLRNSPLPDACIDGVVCLNVLEHIDQDEQAIREIHRMLKPGGIAHIEVPSGPKCYDIYDEYLMHHRRYTMSELTFKVRAAGFKVLNRTHLGALVYPAFYLTKRRNRRWLKQEPEVKAARVKAMMRQTRSSPLVGLAMRLEMILGRLISFPAGIRCVLTLEKTG